MTTENNKIIAEFMSLGKSRNIFIKGHKGYFPSELSYHSDWNWLMEIVEKIENLDDKKYYVVIKHNQCKFANYYTEEIIANVIHTHNKMQSVF